MTTLSLIVDLCAQVLSSGPPEPVAKILRRVQTRQAEPLRVALVGRAKAGKSTLLNALVGERLAASDASESTRVPTWYRVGTTYDVRAQSRTGSVRPIAFHRNAGRLEIDLSSERIEDIEHIEVSWPSSNLIDKSLLDTPGLEAKDADGSHRSRFVLGLDDDGEVQVDAVVYLMRHLHAKDLNFLEAFLEQSISQPSPISSLAVLSRADEIGAGRRDALESAIAIAERYRRDQRISRFCADVLPVAGLLAEAGAALREEEASALRALATLSSADLEQLLLSVDRIAESPLSTVATDVRRALLRRLGFFGVRLCVNALHSGEALSAQDLAQLLTHLSGIEELRVAIAERFSRHSALLKARSGLAGLKEASRIWHQVDASAAGALDQRIERIESSSTVLAALRLIYLSPVAADLDDGERAEILKLVDECARTEATGATVLARRLILEKIAYWRSRSEDPIASPEILEIAQTSARLYETLAATSVSHPVAVK